MYLRFRSLGVTSKDPFGGFQKRKESKADLKFPRGKKYGCNYLKLFGDFISWF